MTGTGTQNDPYIVSTWPDFVTAVGTAGAYVEVAPDTEWDFNDIAPEGAPTVGVLAAHVDGHGCTLKNVRADNVFLNFRAGNATTFENFSIIDFLANSAIFFFGSSQTFTIRGTVLTGVQTGSGTLYRNKGNIVFQANSNSGCGFRVNCRGGDLFSGSYSHSFTDTFFGLSGGNVGTNTATCGQLINCYIEGECGTVFTQGSSRNTIVNCTAQRVHAGGTNMLVNSDKCSNITRGTAVTDEQLRDPVYLASIGFPIGGET